MILSVVLEVILSESVGESVGGGDGAGAAEGEYAGGLGGAEGCECGNGALGRGVNQGTEKEVAEMVDQGVSEGDDGRIDYAGVGAVYADVACGESARKLEGVGGYHFFRSAIGYEPVVAGYGYCGPVAAEAGYAAGHGSGEYYGGTGWHGREQQLGQMAGGDEVGLRG